LPHRRFSALTQLTASTALHVSFIVAAALIATSAPGVDSRRTAIAEQPVGPLVFVAPAMPRVSGGGGGGGNRESAPIRRAQGVGADAVTLRVRKEAAAPVPMTPPSTPAVESVPALPSIVLDAKPVSLGLFEQVGLPTGGVLSGTSQGPGSGGGVGTGIGTGVGPGRGPGLGPGSGGGTGGGVYRAGGTVSTPRLLKEVKPKYTNEALLNRIQGTVVLEAVVTADGCTSQIRVVRSLDAVGLDQEAVTAVAQWRFDPGRLGTVPVDVLVTIVLDFTIR
jgi:periplasmic protein TonB